ncbi:MULTISPECIES: hypothetical protein [Burkholderia]|uniref:Uncharacterized protein n=1 Tax=Burkholderia anthina TaxID=179879 RepID=A0A7T7AJK2_9BURK|nr:MULTISPECIES: hypothetical protein [Burkholderia]MBY4865024.1 hypothetical protein [Burkholderia anthina]QQK04995.1 hypothetical protein JFN94_27190 [Burkholderia anthina]
MHKVDIRSLQLRYLETIGTSQREASIYKFLSALATLAHEFGSAACHYRLDAPSFTPQAIGRETGIAASRRRERTRPPRHALARRSFRLLQMNGDASGSTDAVSPVDPAPALRGYPVRYA